MEVTFQESEVRAGAPLSATVSVELPQPQRCEISVRVRRHVTKQKSFEARAELFDGELAAGTSEVPLLVNMPEGPPSYTGSKFSVEWQVEFELRREGGVFERKSFDIVVKPADSLVPVERRELAETALGMGEQVVFAFTMAGVLGIAVLILLTMAGVAIETALAVGAFSIPVMALLFILFVENEDEELKSLGEVEFGVRDPNLNPGEVITAYIRSEKPVPADLGKVCVRLYRHEQVGAQARHDQQHELEWTRVDVATFAGQPIDTEVKLMVPEHAQPTFRNGELQVAVFCELVAKQGMNRYVDRVPIWIGTDEPAPSGNPVPLMVESE